jgi:hypothetical protein
MGTPRGHTSFGLRGGLFIAGGGGGSGGGGGTGADTTALLCSLPSSSSGFTLPLMASEFSFSPVRDVSQIF